MLCNQRGHSTRLTDKQACQNISECKSDGFPFCNTLRQNNLTFHGFEVLARELSQSPGIAGSYEAFATVFQLVNLVALAVRLQPLHFRESVLSDVGDGLARSRVLVVVTLGVALVGLFRIVRVLPGLGFLCPFAAQIALPLSKFLLRRCGLYLVPSRSQNLVEFLS